MNVNWHGSYNRQFRGTDFIAKVRTRFATFPSESDYGPGTELGWAEGENESPKPRASCLASSRGKFVESKAREE